MKLVCGKRCRGSAGGGGGNGLWHLYIWGWLSHLNIEGGGSCGEDPLSVVTRTSHFALLAYKLSCHFCTAGISLTICSHKSPVVT